MNVRKKPEENYIFYLKTVDDLSDDYYHLAKSLLKYEISLIPIALRDLQKISDLGQREHFLTIIRDLKTFLAFKQIRNKYLNFAIMNKKYCYYDITSFETIPENHRLNYGKSYFKFKLPLGIDDLALDISRIYLGKRKKAKMWPGGKNAKLAFELKRTL